MNVQELFRKIDRQRLYELYCIADEKFAKENTPEIGLKIISETIDEFLSITPTECEEIEALSFEPFENEVMYPEGQLLGDIYGLPKESVKIFLTINGEPELYNDLPGVVDGFVPERLSGIDFIPWSEMLGLPLTDEILDKYGEDVIAVNIFWEMIFYGWTEESYRNRCDDILSRYQ